MSGLTNIVRLVGNKPERSLSIDASKEAANVAYGKAKKAQRHLVTNLRLIELLYRPGMVSGARLRGEVAEAEKQRDRAQAVLDALNECVNALAAQLPEEHR